MSSINEELGVRKFQAELTARHGARRQTGKARELGMGYRFAAPRFRDNAQLDAYRYVALGEQFHRDAWIALNPGDRWEELWGSPDRLTQEVFEPWPRDTTVWVLHLPFGYTFEIARNR